jgi:23S rRNA U2552 (ribose-2'-O)-methylase RlmE/FtsJ
MSFFESYDISLLENPCTCQDESIEYAYRDRFIQRWKSPEYQLFPIHPILESRLVTPTVLALEQELMNTKLDIDKFHQFDPKKEKYYNQVTRILDPFSFYRKEAQKQVHPAKCMTNAWLKCWEMIHVFQLVPNKDHIQLFCNAELPGAFLFALNHYIKTKTNSTYDWVANSLYPSDNTILGDDFGLVKKYPEKWLMSKEHNGSVTDVAMIHRMKDHCQRTVDLYTSDIGIGLTYETFSKQEELEAPLNLGQIICGLETLREGGSLVCKTFMFFSSFSISLLYLTSLCFSEFYIYKPETSRAANSEVYIIGKGFMIKEDIITQLTETLETWSNDKMNTYLVPVPEDFYLTIFWSLHRIYQRQIYYIQQYIHVVKTLYEQGYTAEFHNVRRMHFFKNEQDRLRIWKNKFSIPFLETSL